jgi:hypothetical protein
MDDYLVVDETNPLTKTTPSSIFMSTKPMLITIPRSTFMLAKPTLITTFIQPSTTLSSLTHEVVHDASIV